MAVKLKGFVPLIQVFDMPKSVAFYRDVLGFAVVAASPERAPDDFDWGLLQRDRMELMLNTAYESDSRPEKPDAARVAVHDDTGFFFGCPDVDGAYRELVRLGLDVEPPKDAPYGMRQLYLRDPDGYVICLQWPVAREAGAEDEGRPAG